MKITCGCAIFSIWFTIQAAPPTSTESAPRQTDPAREPINLTLPAKGAAAINLLTTKTRSESSGASRTFTVTAQWPSTLEVIDSTESGVIVKWTRGQVRTHPPVALPPDLAAAEALRVEQPLELEIGRHGELLQVVNFEVLRKQIELSRSAANARQQKQTQSGHELQGKASQILEEIFADRKMAETIMTKEIMPYFAMYGTTLERGKAQELDTELENVLGGKPFPCKSTIQLQNIAADGAAHIHYTQTVDPYEARVIMHEWMCSFIQKEEDKPQLVTISLPHIFTQADYVYDPKSGWIREMSLTRTFEVDRKKRIDTISWTTDADSTSRGKSPGERK